LNNAARDVNQKITAKDGYATLFGRTVPGGKSPSMVYYTTKFVVFLPYSLGERGNGRKEWQRLEIEKLKFRFFCQTADLVFISMRQVHAKSGRNLILQIGRIWVFILKY
jgi:hypothetical protein